MGEPVTRRDFIDGVAAAIVAGGARSALGFADSGSGAYPPARTGYGGSRPEDFAIAHGVRGGRRYDLGVQPVTQRYDVIVIGAGIGGLSTAPHPRPPPAEARAPLPHHPTAF